CALLLRLRAGAMRHVPHAEEREARLEARTIDMPRHSAARTIGDGAGTARSCVGSGFGHHRSSHLSSNRFLSCGATFCANRREFSLVTSLLILPNCNSSMRWP